MVRIKVLRHTGNKQETSGQNSGRREALKSRGKGNRKEALVEVDEIEWYGASHPGQES